MTSPPDTRSRSKRPANDPDGDPALSRGTRFHAFAALAFVLVSGGLYAAFVAATRTAPSRGYTTLGTWLGIGASACFLFALLYSLRKRAGQEWMPGRLQTWLRLHLWISLLGTVAVLLHAGFHVDGGVGTVALVVLSLTVVTGLGGWWLYVKVPPVVRARVDNLAIPGVVEARDRLAARLEDLAAGDRSDAFRAQYAALVGRPGGMAVGALREGEESRLVEARRLHDEVRDLDVRLAAQRRLYGWLRGWLWVHVPAAFLLVPAVVWHVYDAEEWGLDAAQVRPEDYADPATCARCHEKQYREWSSSSHALAMSSPVMEFQTRLVELKEREQLRTHLIGERIVGDLCVRCHAPTGYPRTNPGASEATLSLARERAPASRTGVSCVACHQVSRVHPIDPEDVRAARVADFERAFPGGRLPDGRVVTTREAVLDPHRTRDPAFGIPYKNIENLIWTQGRRMIGPFATGQDGVLASIGNDAHRGEGMAVMREPEFCASCHTVVVDNPNDHGRRVVTLQNTYGEWRDLGDEGVRWGDDPGPSRHGETHCMQCHSMDLTSVAAFAQGADARRLSLEGLQRQVRERLTRLELPQDDTRAAAPADGFDQPLPTGRRRYLHRFVGVDHHLGESPGERAEAAEWTKKLLQIAAAIRIGGFDGDGRVLDAGGKLNVEVANLATGHNLPAGFAFAREIWVEVSVSDAATRPSADDPRAWKVVVGGSEQVVGDPLGDDERLDKTKTGLRNFQAVLFDANGKRDARDTRDRSNPNATGAETVLQNETTDVLKGGKAREKGFLDRVDPLPPGGKSKNLAIELPSGWRGPSGSWVRVRLRFRSLPPEFIERLADRFDAQHDTGDGKWPEGPAAACRALVQRLHIVDMASDVASLR